MTKKELITALENKAARWEELVDINKSINEKIVKKLWDNSGQVLDYEVIKELECAIEYDVMEKIRKLKNTVSVLLLRAAAELNPKHPPAILKEEQE